MEQNDIVQHARVRAVGIGPVGAEMVQILSRNFPAGISCHEVAFNPKTADTEEISALISIVQESDLLFILSGLEDEYFRVVAQSVACSAREAGILMFAIIPDDERISQQIITELTEADVAVLPVSEHSLTDEQNLPLEKTAALTGYAMRHIVARLTNLICYQSFISTYGADREATLQKGCVCRIGVGVATGPSKGRNAAALALKRLGNQGVPTLEAVDLTVIVESSPHSYTDDWNDACEVIRNNIADGTHVLISLEMNDYWGCTGEIRVTVLAEL